MKKKSGLHTVRFKSFAYTTGILLLSFLILSCAFTGIGYRFAVRQKQAEMVRAAQEIGKTVGAVQADMELRELELRMILSSFSAITDADIQICTADGEIVSCSDQTLNCEHLGRVVTEKNRSLLLETGESGVLTDLDGVFDVPRFVISERVADSENAVLCYVLVSMVPNELTDLWRGFASIFYIAALAVLLIAFVVAVFISERVTHPVKEMVDAADSFARGEYSVRVSNDLGSDEIQELARSFNAMADSIELQEKQRAEFIANISHELKTPMTTITGFADGILDGTIPEKEQKKYLSVISSETKRLSRLVRNMLETSRLQSMDRTAVLNNSFDITDVVGLTLLSLEQKINAKDLEVSANFPEERIYVRGDKDALTEVVYNLLDNAIKFSNPGTPLNTEIWKQNDKVFVSVENFGETIPKEELPDIFRRFYKTDHSRGRDPDGVGLGLCIVKTILDHHGEDVFVVSENGRTKFTFSLTPSQKNASQES